MAGKDDLMVLGNAIATGSLRIELLGDKDVAKSHIHEARKLVAQLRSIYGVTERIAIGEPGGFYQHIVELVDGSTMIASTNNGYDVVRIIGVGVAPEVVPVEEEPVVIPEEDIPEEEDFKDILIAVRSGFGTTNVDLDIYKFSVENNTLAKIASNIPSQGGFCSGVTTYLAFDRTGAGVMYKKDWTVLTTLSISGSGPAQCVFSQGVYYAQAGGTYHVINEKGVITDTFSAGLSGASLIGGSERSGGGLCTMISGVNFQDPVFTVRNAKGGVIGSGSAPTISNPEYTIFGFNQVASSDKHVYTPHWEHVGSILSTLAAAPPYLAKWSNSGSLLGVDTGTPIRELRSNTRRGLGVMAFTNNKLYAVDERSIFLTRPTTAADDTILRVYTDDLVLETSVASIFSGIASSPPELTVLAFHMVVDHTPNNIKALAPVA